MVVALGPISLDPQKTALPLVIERVHGGEQPRAHDQPGTEVLVDVENEHEILVLQISPDRRDVAGPGAEDRLAAEIDGHSSGQGC